MKKTNLAKLLALAVVSVMLLSSLVGCFGLLGGGGDETESDTVADTNNTNNDTEGNKDTDKDTEADEDTEDTEGDEETEGEESDAESKETEAEETQPKETDTWGQDVVTSTTQDQDLNFGGAEVGIACRAEARYRREISMDTLEGDPLNMQIFLRNKAVESELNCKLKFIEADDLWGSEGRSIPNYVKTEYEAGTNSAVDVIFANAAYTVHNDVRAYLQNLNADEMSYMDIDQPYWNQNYVKNATCYDQLYYIIGDLTLTIYDKAMVNFVNFNMLKSIGYQPSDIYDLIEDAEGNKNWTFDQFQTIVLEFTPEDTDGNYEVNRGDKVRVSSIYPSEALDGYFAAFELEAIQTNDDGSHTITLDGNTKFADAATMMYNFYQLDGMYKVNDIHNTWNNFIDGNSLFHTDIIYRNADYNKQMRNVEFDYGILPLPMYDDSQLGYHTTSQDAYNAISVLNNKEDEFAMISAYLDLMCAKSYSDVRPFYIEKMMKTEYADDADSTRMIEIIMNGLTYDTGTIYSFQMNRVAMDTWRECAGKGTTLSERWAAIQTETIEAVRAFDMFFQASQYM